MTLCALQLNILERAVFLEHYPVNTTLECLMTTCATSVMEPAPVTVGEMLLKTSMASQVKS